MRVLLVGRDVSHASTRFRLMQYERPLTAHGVVVERMEWIPRTSLDVTRLTSQLLRRARRSDVVMLLKPRLHPASLELLRRANPRLVVDFDDAIWTWPPVFADRFDRSARAALAISAGSAHLAAAASRRYPHALVERIPTAVETDQYACRDPEPGGRPPVVGWIGNTPSLGDFSDDVARALEALVAERTVEVRIVSGHPLVRNDLTTTFEPWSLATEIESLGRFDIGIMPLRDDESSRGRCGLKAIQYMARGVATIASPVGAATEIIQDGVNGILAATAEEWAAAIELLATSPEHRAALGAAGRQRVEQDYSVSANVPRLLALLERVAEQR